MAVGYKSWTMYSLTFVAFGIRSTTLARSWLHSRMSAATRHRRFEGQMLRVWRFGDAAMRSMR